MRIPTDLERERLMHEYDPVKAREYYLRTRKLKGRKKAAPKPTGSAVATKVNLSTSTKLGAKAQIAKNARAKQRKELSESIKKLEDRLKKLEKLIKTRAREEAAENRKAKAKRERAAKERDKPASAAEKAEAARENKKYRDKNRQKLKTAAKRDSKSGGSSSESDTPKKKSVSELKSLATKVRGQIAVAKQKLAAL